MSPRASLVFAFCTRNVMVCSVYGQNTAFYHDPSLQGELLSFICLGQTKHLSQGQ